ncbi:MAG: hypothetical protein ACHP7O_05470 [Burkholderiales bacterium]
MKAVDSIFVRRQRRERTTQVKPPPAQPAKLLLCIAAHAPADHQRSSSAGCHLALPFSRVRQLSEPAEVYHILAGELLCLADESRLIDSVELGKISQKLLYTANLNHLL